MIRSCQWLCVCLALVCALPLLASEVDVTPEAPTPEVTVDIGGKPAKTPPATGPVAIIIVTDHPGNLYTSGQPIDLVVSLNNPGDAERASMTTHISTSSGCPVYTDMGGVKLPDKGQVTQTIHFDGARLPKGSYRVDVVVEGEKAYGYGWTLFSLWDGPAKNINPAFGISYNGPLNTDNTWVDLDFFKQAGVGWLRFPLRGWLPQGTAMPRETEQYKRFISEAGARNFTLMAAFTPTVTVDPAVNQEQADKEYRESLQAAAAHFGPQIPYWELLTVKPDPLYPEMRGIRPTELSKGREALRGFNKNLVAIFPLETPFSATMMDLAAVGLPQKGDLLGAHYDFVGLPEMHDANPKAPLYEMPEVTATSQALLKRVPPLWVTEYGFDPTKGERLPSSTYQAALLARAFILNRAAGIERTFWRHNPASQFDLPFTTPTGVAQPNYLAMRTMLEQMDGATLVSEVAAPDGLHAFLFGKGDLSKKSHKRNTVSYLLVMWVERVPTAVTLKIGAAHARIIDLWGNATEFDPVENTILTSVDEFPCFVDLGASSSIELLSPFAHFEPPRVMLQTGGENTFSFKMLNDPRVFTSMHAFEVSFRRWPGTEEVKTFKAPFAYQYDRYDRTFPLAAPDNARKGQVYEVTAEIKVAARRVGLLTLPVWYNPGAK